MNKHQLTGSIIAKEPNKVYHKKSPYLGNRFYKLTILSEPKEQEEFIFVYPNVVSAEIFQTIQQTQYIDRRYLFTCQRKPKRLVLTDWRELPNNNAFIQQKNQENLKDYEN